MRTTLGTAHAFAADLLTAAGLNRDNALLTADVLITAEKWGSGSHGMLRLPHYLRRLAAGGHRADAQLQVVTDSGALVVHDGQTGLGHWQLWRAAELGVQRAGEHGISLIAVGNSGHCGALGVFTRPALEAGFACLVFSNGPAVMPAWGGSVPLLSTSPLAAGMPGPDPAIIDMATSSVARGRIAAAAARGEQLPEGWALDADGRPTTDPQQALSGMLAPLGGAKGFALAYLVEALTGGLVGPAPAAEVADMFDPSVDAEPQAIAHTVITIDAARLDAAADPQAAQQRLAALQHAVTSSGGRVPGAAKTGLHPADLDAALELVDAAVADLVRAADRLEVAVPHQWRDGAVGQPENR